MNTRASAEFEGMDLEITKRSEGSSLPSPTFAPYLGRFPAFENELARPLTPSGLHVPLQQRQTLVNIPLIHFPLIWDIALLCPLTTAVTTIIPRIRKTEPSETCEMLRPEEIVGHPHPCPPPTPQGAARLKADRPSFSPSQGTAVSPADRAGSASQSRSRLSPTPRTPQPTGDKWRKQSVTFKILDSATEKTHGTDRWGAGCGGPGGRQLHPSACGAG